jgi:hypothetical protein
MAIAICSECGSPVEIAGDEEWGYCPMCENDQVALKRKSVMEKLLELSEEIVLSTETESKYGRVVTRKTDPVIRVDRVVKLFKELEAKGE